MIRFILTPPNKPFDPHPSKFLFAYVQNMYTPKLRDMSKSDNLGRISHIYTSIN